MCVNKQEKKSLMITKNKIKKNQETYIDQDI